MSNIKRALVTLLNCLMVKNHATIWQFNNKTMFIHHIDNSRFILVYFAP